MLRLYNSLSRQKEGFVPITPRKVNMYVCGMTVYDRCHLGHARMFLVFDMVYRWLMSSGYDVTYVRNITDIDDHIIARAAQNNEPVEALTARMIEYMNRDLSRLMVLKPSHEPRATQFVPEMVELIQTLIDRDLAYPAENGDVYYSVHKFTGYGKLSGKTLDDLRAGERVEIGTHKRDPLDFVLWKASKPNEPKWPSPWGEGRPGWHIECSAMSEHFLGSHFDIHGGGHDLQFPHHENEIAQSEGAHGHTFVNYWAHNGFLRVNDEKMSKSLGNFFLIDDVLKEYPAEVIRFFMLRGHYRGPINYTVAHLADAKQALTTLYLALRDVSSGAESAQVQWDEPHAIRFKAAMDDDFNTPEALAVLFDLAHEVNRTKAARQAGLLKGLGGMLGLLQQDARSYLQGGEEAARPEDATAITAGSGAYTAEAIESLIAARAAARKHKQFAESDRIRNELVQAGIILEDGPQGTTWRRK